jgi:hypothetical protein
VSESVISVGVNEVIDFDENSVRRTGVEIESYTYPLKKKTPSHLDTVVPRFRRSLLISLKERYISLIAHLGIAGICLLMTLVYPPLGPLLGGFLLITMILGFMLTLPYLSSKGISRLFILTSILVGSGSYLLAGLSIHGPRATDVSIGGIMKVGESLQVQIKWSDFPLVPITKKVSSWKRCDLFGKNCLLISTSKGHLTYKLGSSDKGHTIRFVETATDSLGVSSSASSLLSAPISN